MLHGEVADPSTRTLMRGAEPVVRLLRVRQIEYFPLIVTDLPAEAIEPCQIGNKAALRFNFRVAGSSKEENISTSRICICR